ncbi:MAG: hypothetical protein ACYC5K_07815 [Saccharofermentanales bacterium]
MTRRMIPSFLIFLLLAVSFRIALVDCVAAEGIVVDVPVTVSFANATGIDLNLRLNHLLVKSAEFVRPAAVLDDAL